MRIAVTGGAGFIGSHLTEKLLQADHDVLCVDCLDRFYPAPVKLANLSAALHHPRFILSAQDLCDEPALRETFHQFQPEVVFHLAATAGVRPSIQRPMTYVQANLVASQSVLSASLDAGVERVILAGSSSVYGRDQPAPFREDCASGEPQSPYAASKRGMELLAAAHCAVHEATVTVCRLFTVYGPRQRPDLAISRFVRAMLADRPITVYGDGSFARDFTFVDDTVSGLLAAIGAPKGYRIYNIGAGRPTTVRDLISTIERVLERRADIRRDAEQPGDVPLTYASVDRARDELGWTTSVGLEEGIRRFVAWARSAPEVYFRVGEPWGLGSSPR
jgi:UDP-glucuronate 4-epimerase